MSPTDDDLDVPAVRQLLREADVAETAYCLPGDPLVDGAVVLGSSGRVWSTFIYERGERVETRSYLSESEACEELLRRLRPVFPSIPATTEGRPGREGTSQGVWPA